MLNYERVTAGWCFGTFFILHIIYWESYSKRTNIFRGGETTNQTGFSMKKLGLMVIRVLTTKYGEVSLRLESGDLQQQKTLRIHHQ